MERCKRHRPLTWLALLVVLLMGATACASLGETPDAAAQSAAESDAGDVNTNVAATSEIVGDAPTAGPEPLAEAPEVSEDADAEVMEPDEAAVDEDDRIVEGLISIYSFDEGSGDTVADPVGGYDLTIADVGAVEWTASGLRLVASTTLENPETPTALIDAIVASGEITVEAWIETNDLEQNGPARIVSISGDTQTRNLTLGQGVHGGTGNFIDFRLRTTETDDNGTPSLAGPDGVLSTDLTHLVASRDADGGTALYFDGVQQSTGVAGGDLSNWDTTYRLLVGNEATGDRPWIGTLHLVAIYDRALSDAEVAQNFAAGS